MHVPISEHVPVFQYRQTGSAVIYTNTGELPLFEFSQKAFFDYRLKCMYKALELKHG